jgi:hypothetical protein
MIRSYEGARRTSIMSNVRHPTNYEKSDADPRLITALALGIAIFLLATPFILRAGYPSATLAGAVPPHLAEPPAPRLQTDPKSDLVRLRSYERGELDRLGWADRDRDLVRIPIDRAMQLLVERGLPGWPAAVARADNSTPR